MIVNVEDRPDLKKDTISGAILNVNKKEKDQYLSKRAELNRQKEEMEFLKSKLKEIDNIKNDMLEIKELLKGLSK